MGLATNLIPFKPMFSTLFIGKIEFALLKIKLWVELALPASSTPSFGRGSLVARKNWCALASRMGVTGRVRLIWAEQTHQWACSREGMLSLDRGFKRTHPKLTGNAFSTARCCNSVLWPQTILWSSGLPIKCHLQFIWHSKNVLSSPFIYLY